MTANKLLSALVFVACALWIIVAFAGGIHFDRYHHLSGRTTPGGFDPVPVFHQTEAELSFRGAHCEAATVQRHQLPRCTL